MKISVYKLKAAFVMGANNITSVKPELQLDTLDTLEVIVANLFSATLRMKTVRSRNHARAAFEGCRSELSTIIAEVKARRNPEVNA